MPATIHPTAEVSASAQIGEGTRVWHEAQVREGARIGRECILGKGVYVDRDVVVGDRCKIQNRASLFHGVTLEDGVFVGPHVVFANDRSPRAVNPDGSLKSDADWDEEPVLVRQGASLGAGAVVLPGVTIGAWAMIGAGAVVAKDVPAHAIVKGNPARIAGWACTCGRPLHISEAREWHCALCGRSFHVGEFGE
ncbi:MAG: N-acetyltransferase [Chloroflexi bacterium]|nr:N-acetyltransferase [Chloroflexota bacterium]